MRRVHASVLVCLIICCALGPPAVAQAPLGAGAAQQLKTHYTKAKSWAVKAIVLLALERSWHPLLSEIVQDALLNKDRRLRAMGIETLRRADDETLKAAASKSLVDALIRKRMGDNHALFRQRLTDVLGRLFGDTGAKGKASWQRWWAKKRETYAPPKWDGPADAGTGKPGTMVPKYVTRALDLSKFGIEVMICIDTTGSMQTTIDAARDGLTDIVAVLKGISPKFRIGLVGYNDDPGKHAELLSRLTPNVKAVQKILGKQRAFGGADFPERVDQGLELALRPNVGWSRDANKIVVIIGDAPCHPADEQKAKDLAKKAYEVGKAGKDPQRGVELTGGSTRPKPKKRVRPIITCTINVGPSPETARVFGDIAKAGGGAYESMSGPIGPQRKVKKDVSGIVERIIALSFGHNHSTQTTAFVKIYLEYRKALYFR